MKNKPLHWKYKCADYNCTRLLNLIMSTNEGFASFARCFDSIFLMSIVTRDHRFVNYRITLLCSFSTVAAENTVTYPMPLGLGFRYRIFIVYSLGVRYRPQRHCMKVKWKQQYHFIAPMPLNISYVGYSRYTIVYNAHV